jgi:hypothetical protein
MANLYVTLNSQLLYPSFPLEVREYPVGDELSMANGNERFYHVADRREWVLTRQGATEAERVTWRNASPLNTAITYIDEHGTSYTVRVVERNIPMTASQPPVENAPSSIGPTFYDVAITLRQIQ